MVQCPNLLLLFLLVLLPAYLVYQSESLVPVLLYHPTVKHANALSVLIHEIPVADRDLHIVLLLRR
jgi:hypothetical protein